MPSVVDKNALATKTVVELKQTCRDDGISKYSGKTKPELIEHMMAHYGRATLPTQDNVTSTVGDLQQIRLEPEELPYGLTDENIGRIRKMAKRFEKDSKKTEKKEYFWGRIITDSYWDNRGRYQKLHDALFQILVPAHGKCEFAFGEPLRMLSKVIYDYYNNGWCNLLDCYVEYVETILEWTRSHDYPEDARVFVWFMRDIVQDRPSYITMLGNDEDEDDDDRVLQWDKEDDQSMHSLMDAIVKWTADAALNNADRAA